VAQSRDGREKRQGKGRARGYVKGRREDVREEKDGGGKEESKGKLGCAPPETKSWLRHCSVNKAIDVAQNHPLWRLMSTFGATHS